MWSLFRVENEHCSNVGHFRASRDVPLPYELQSSDWVDETDGGADHVAESHRPADEEQPLTPHLSRTSTAPPQNYASGADLDRVRSSTRRRRASFSEPQQQPSPMARGLQRMGTALRTAHNQDFEKKKKPELGKTAVKDEDSDDDDDDEDGEAESVGASYSASQSEDREDRDDIHHVREELSIGRAGPAS